MIAPREESPGHRLNLKLYRVVLSLGIIFLILNSFGPLMDNVDLGWLVAHGRWMIEHDAFYHRDVMNYPNLGHSLVDEYPLFEVVLYGVWKWGWWAVSLFTAAIYAALFIILVRAARTYLPGGTATFTLTLGAMMLYFESAPTLRPHLITYLALAITGVFLLNHRRLVYWQDCWPLAIVQIGWTNCHSAFVLGPIMVGLFGAEMVIRESWRQRAIAFSTLRPWLGAFLLVLLACLVNPSGVARFYPAFYQGSLESIRAYVSEMQPRPGFLGSVYTWMGIFTGLSLLRLAVYRYRAVSFSFVILAVLLFFESLSVQKSWPVFGMFLPLVALSCGALTGGDRVPAPTGWPSLLGQLALAVLLSVAFAVRLQPSSPASLHTVWRDYRLGRRELPYPAVNWMVHHGIEGRLLHRCEDGGLLQLMGYDRGQTFGDTGFGKYDEKQIHLVAMLGERPGLLPLYLAQYHPSFILCNNYCFRWPIQLRKLNWRLIFYSPYGEVWTAPGTRTDLATVKEPAIDAAFMRDLAQHGRPYDISVLGRSIVTLNSLGREDCAFAQLTSLPKEMHHLPFYWEAASILCFEEPGLSPVHRQELFQEAQQLHEDGVTAEFRALILDQSGNSEEARKTLLAAPRGDLTAQGADLLLKIEDEQNRPEALALAHDSSLFELRDGRHWEYVAVAEEHASHLAAAEKAWSQALFYFPDEPKIVAGARAFAAAHPDLGLDRALAASTSVRDN